MSAHSALVRGTVTPRARLRKNLLQVRPRASTMIAVRGRTAPMPRTEAGFDLDAALASRTLRAPRGSQLHCKGWLQEAALRMLCNNLDPEVAERPQDLVVYGGI